MVVSDEAFVMLLVRVWEVLWMDPAAAEHGPPAGRGDG
jgi:predicted lactoylglutathione lyase